MKNIMKNFKFGPMQDSRLGISHLGLAVKNTEGSKVAYDKTNGNLVDVDFLNMDTKGMVMQMPVSIKSIQVGDTILHAGVPVFVTKVKTDEDGKVSIKAVSPIRGEKIEILPTRSVFGFDFVTKVMSLLDGFGSTANEENPFGNLMPLMMMGGMDSDSNPMMMMAMMSMMNGGESNSMFNMNDPMMMMAMMGGFGGGSNDINPFMAMMMAKEL